MEPKPSVPVLLPPSSSSSSSSSSLPSLASTATIAAGDSARTLIVRAPSAHSAVSPVSVKLEFDPKPIPPTTAVMAAAIGAKHRHRRAESGGSAEKGAGHHGYVRSSLRRSMPMPNPSDRQHLQELSRLVEKNAELLSPPAHRLAHERSANAEGAVGAAREDSTAKPPLVPCDPPVGAGKSPKRDYYLHAKSKSEHCLARDMPAPVTTGDTTGKPLPLARGPRHAKHPRRTHCKKLSDSYIIVQAQRERQRTHTKVQSLAQHQFEFSSIGITPTPPPAHKPRPPPSMPVRPKTQVDLIDQRIREARALGHRPHASLASLPSEQARPHSETALDSSMPPQRSLTLGRSQLASRNKAAPSSTLRSQSMVDEANAPQQSRQSTAESQQLLSEERRRRLAHLLKIQTQAEALYVRRLETLCDRFYEPLKRRYGAVRRWITFGSGGTGTRSERMRLLERIFGQVVVLLEFHRDFLSKLRTLDNLALATSVRAVVGLFQKRRQGFEADVEYLHKYPAALTTFENLCFRDGRFRKAVRTCEVDAGHVNVRAFLGTPKEQLRRYTQFMARICELCPEDSFDKPDAIECHATLEQMLERAAPAIAQAEELEEAALVHLRVTRLPHAVLSPSQRLVQQGSIFYRSHHDTREYPVQCYLLRDRIILADPTHEGNLFEHRRTIMLASVRLAPKSSDPVTQENIVRLGTHDDTVILRTADYASFCQWAQLIYDLKAQIPAETRVVSRSGRRRQLEHRLSNYSLRTLDGFQNPRLDAVRRAIGISVQ
ncbi:hypothetical protein SYNPS1DRAFT_27504 [Syncephalis pseudoplumigaleata]|uniref:DH domain-containing protein n=1 Tax=Syncephalis pseudoplumigaleata TaxID=1712513 RepID=A0A4P9Z310_9FUNG|nr:hypothetical protein SYNPS1DRAFT_27504 [Syncephalis pseudoplumigaleata]|eukprot:RKP26816.1 hypothetical protein SYNPS1DRAFT_27504 [Syncephalis pseudoplumigaleata]